MKNKGYAKFGVVGRGGGGANKVHYRRCASGILRATLTRASTLFYTIAGKSQNLSDVRSEAGAFTPVR